MGRNRLKRKDKNRGNSNNLNHSRTSDSLNHSRTSDSLNHSRAFNRVWDHSECLKLLICQDRPRLPCRHRHLLETSEVPRLKTRVSLVSSLRLTCSNWRLASKSYDI